MEFGLFCGGYVSASMRASDPQAEHTRLISEARLCEVAEGEASEIGRREIAHVEPQLRLAAAANVSAVTPRFNRPGARVVADELVAELEHDLALARIGARPERALHVEQPQPEAVAHAHP